MEKSLKSESLAGRSIVISGGGMGIGAACAVLLAREGAAVTICGRTHSKLEATADRIRAEGGKVHYLVADFTIETDVEKVMDEAASFGGGLHGVVANAGGDARLAPYHLQSVDNFLSVLHTNVLTTMLSIKHSVKAMAEAGGGSFVGLSSLAGIRTHPYFGAYTAAKSGVSAMMRNAADEYGRAGVRFNAIAPGYTKTESLTTLEPGTPLWDQVVSQTPMEGIAQAEDIANAARFLLSDESRWITGQTLAVDGGHSLRRGAVLTPSMERAFGAEALAPALR